MGSVAVDTEDVAQVSSSLENTEIERSKVGIMRALVEREDPSAKVVISQPSLLLFLSHRYSLYS